MYRICKKQLANVILHLGCTFRSTVGGSVYKMSKWKNKQSQNVSTSAQSKKQRFSARNAFRGLQEAVDEIFGGSESDDLPDMVIIPPNLDELTDEEDINDNIITNQAVPIEIPGTIELMLPDVDESEDNPNIIEVLAESESVENLAEPESVENLSKLNECFQDYNKIGKYTFKFWFIHRTEARLINR